ncbi:MAG: TRAP transporter substrate-binding protein DctP [Pseudomonadota bacterium]
MMRRSRNLLVVVLSLFLVLGLSNWSLAQDYPAMKLKAASWIPAGSFTNAMLEWFVEDIEKKTGGKVTFDKYWGGALYGGVESLESLQHGVADFCMIPPSYTPGKLPLGYSHYAFPFAPRKAAVMVSIMGQLYQEFPWMHDELKAHGIKVLYMGTVSDYGILSREPIKRLDDLKNKKLVQLGGYFADWTQAAGIVPVSGISSSDRYERLRTGVVEGSLLTPSFFVDYKEYEVAKHCVMVGLGARVPMFMSINQKTWEKMTPDLQKLFMEVGLDVQKRHAQATDEKLEKDLKVLQEKGVTYYGYLPEEDLTKWGAAVPDTAAKMCKSLEQKFPDIWKMADRLIELSEKAGHKWPRKFAVK